MNRRRSLAVGIVRVITVLLSKIQSRKEVVVSPSSARAITPTFRGNRTVASPTPPSMSASRSFLRSAGKIDKSRARHPAVQREAESPGTSRRCNRHSLRAHHRLLQFEAVYRIIAETQVPAVVGPKRQNAANRRPFCVTLTSPRPMPRCNVIIDHWRACFTIPRD